MLPQVQIPGISAASPHFLLPALGAARQWGQESTHGGFAVVCVSFLSLGDFTYLLIFCFKQFWGLGNLARPKLIELGRYRPLETGRHPIRLIEVLTLAFSQ